MCRQSVDTRQHKKAARKGLYIHVCIYYYKIGPRESVGNGSQCIYHTQFEIHQKLLCEVFCVSARLKQTSARREKPVDGLCRMG